MGGLGKMNLLLVRHGHPDYEHDCLTELGHTHAALCAQRLKNTKIDEIYSSSCGRAFETAMHTAELKNMNVTKLDFMREIGSGPKEGEERKAYEALPLEKRKEVFREEYSVWVQAKKTVAENAKLDFSAPRFARNCVYESVSRVKNGLDEWLKYLGYKREGDYYRVLKENNDTVALFGHGGSFSVLISRLFNIPFEQCIAMLHIDYTAISEIAFEGEYDSLIYPKLKLFGDASHTEATNEIKYD